jgi:hypothetical protein
LWHRLEAALGSGYAQSWASDFVIASLGGKTVIQAIESGHDYKEIWRAVHQTLGLPDKFR